jgi:hypothetical protein
MAKPNDLRTIASLMRPARGFTLSDADMIDDAADEIERLTALVEFYEKGGKSLDQIAAEIEAEEAGDGR